MRLIIILFLLIVIFTLSQKKEVKQKQTCIGYTKIDYDKAINCNGDIITVEPIGVAIQAAMKKVR